MKKKAPPLPNPNNPLRGLRRPTTAALFAQGRTVPSAR